MSIKPISCLPDFTIKSYRELIAALLQSNYQFTLVRNLANDTLKPDLISSAHRVIYLRHDIDFYLNGVDQISRLEADLGVVATYYVLLTEQYNPLHPTNIKIIREMVSQGHEIGLHYDLTLYPTDLSAANEQLAWEADTLSRITKRPVTTIVTHQPFRGLPDPFRSQDHYVHPHDPRYQANLTYISDSARSWRDETLLKCFTDSPPQRLLLNTHPEFWLGHDVQNRWVYSEEVMYPNITAISEKSLRDQQVVWQNHIATQLHDAREVK